MLVIPLDNLEGIHIPSGKQKQISASDGYCAPILAHFISIYELYVRFKERKQDNFADEDGLRLHACSIVTMQKQFLCRH